MTKKERFDWLGQINRIHSEEKKQRFSDYEDEIKYIKKLNEEEKA